VRVVYPLVDTRSKRLLKIAIQKLKSRILIHDGLFPVSGTPVKLIFSCLCSIVEPSFTGPSPVSGPVDYYCTYTMKIASKILLLWHTYPANVAKCNCSSHPATLLEPRQNAVAGSVHSELSIWSGWGDLRSTRKLPR
jgi:hypothetical protein